MEKRTNKMGIDNQKTSFEHQSLEVSMLDKDNFSDEELDSYLSKGEIKATDKVTIPPKILFVGDCTIATFGNFSASTGKAKSKKTLQYLCHGSRGCYQHYGIELQSVSSRRQTEDFIFRY